LQASAAWDDPELREIVRAGYGELVAFVERASGLRAEQIADFFARAMLIDFLTAIDLDSRPEPWSERLLGAIRPNGGPWVSVPR
jgi:hypothetical protein